MHLKLLSETLYICTINSYVFWNGLLLRGTRSSYSWSVEMRHSWLRNSITFSEAVGLNQACAFSTILLFIFMEKICRNSRDVACLLWWPRDWIPAVRGWCDSWDRACTSKPQAMVLSWRTVNRSLTVRSESLPQVKEFKCLGSLLMSRDEMECCINQNDATSAVMLALSSV